MEVLPPDEVVRLLRAATRESLCGAVWIEGDGSGDPHIATYTLANAARELGVRIETGRRVTGIRLGPSLEVTAVEADAGRRNGAKLEVEVLGEPVGAVVAEDTLTDPANDRRP